MKKALSLVIVALMILGLAGCASEGQQLYEKYAPIIDMLEAKDYQGAIREITSIAIAEQQGNVEKLPTMQVLADSWYTSYDRAPAELTFNQDGTCTIGGKAMTWLADESEDPTWLHAQIFEDGVLQYFLELNTSDANAMPALRLSYAEERDGEIYHGDHVGNYYNHPLASKMLTNWRAISDYERVTDEFYIDLQEIRIGDFEYKWSVTNGDSQDSLSIALEPVRDAMGDYTMTISLRDGSPVVHVTDGATGKTGMYISYNYEYDRSWPEFTYLEALENWNEYLEYGSFWCDMTGENYSDGNDNALAYLQDQFTALGDYADAADYLANFDALRFSRAMRYLTRFEERNNFWIGETNYPWNLETLNFIKGLFEEISDYPEAATVLENWDAVLYNRAMYYLDCYINRNSIYFEDKSFHSYNDNYDQALAYIYPLFAEIADYSEAADILDRFTILENKYLSYNYSNLDHMGNESKYGEYTSPYKYNALGQLRCYRNYDENGRIYGVSANNAYHTYDDDGKLVETRLGYDEDDVTAIITPTYDENGNMISQHVVYNSGEHDIFYTYDDQNRLVEIRRPYSSSQDMESYYYYYAYTYDDAGRLTEKVYGCFYNGKDDWKYITGYVYDAAGIQIQETDSYVYYQYDGTVSYSRTHTAECITDDLGNVIQKNWTYGSTIYKDGTESRNSYVSATYNYTYGDVYFFDSTGMEIAE